MTSAQIWRLPQVLKQTGLSRSTIYEMIECCYTVNLTSIALCLSAILAWQSSARDGFVRNAVPSGFLFLRAVKVTTMSRATSRQARDSGKT